MLHLISERRYSSAKVRKFTDVCMVRGTNLPCQKLKKRKLWKGLSPLLLIRRIQPKYFHKFCKLTDYEVITITSTARETAKEQSKSTTLHGYHALLYISSPSAFPFRKRPLPFLRHLENFWTLLLRVFLHCIKRKVHRNPRVKPGSRNKTHYSKLIVPFTLTVVA